MSWSNIMLCVVAGLPLLMAGCAGPVGPFPEAAADLTPPAPVPEPWMGTGCTGVVCAIGPDWFELAAGWERGIGATWREGGWVPEELTDAQREQTARPRRITASRVRASGHPKVLDVLRSHRLSDLQVGDKVIVFSVVSRDWQQEWSSEIWIVRRPGGKIPVYHGENLPGGPFLHLRDQAEQDWEEKGIPIPAKYLSNGRAPWTNPPYPPVAPLPREGKR